MVKARKQGRAGRKASFENSQAAVGSAKDSDRDGPGLSSRLQKKISRKTTFLARVATSAVATSGGVKKKQPQGKKRISKALGDLSTLEDVLKTMAPDKRSAATKAQKPDKPGLGGTGSSLSRMKITKSENKRLQTVITHPQYKANPLSAIMSHLEATLPTRNELPKQKTTKKQANGNSKKKSKGKKRVDDMEM